MSHTNKNDDSNAELSHPEYWDARYDKAKPTEVDHEWFRGFAQLKAFLLKHLPSASSDPKILHLGCGTSEITHELYELGYHAQMNVDFAAKAIELMRHKHAALKGVEWLVMDIRKMDFGDETFDVAFDKGTLDAMLYGSLWELEDEVKANTTAYVNDVFRVMKPGGLWLYVTFRQPHFIRPIVSRDGWEVNVETLGGENGTFEYFGWVIRKK